MKEIIAATHGEKSEGANPGLTAKGYADVKDLIGKVLLATGGVIENVFVGTGLRFFDVYDALELEVFKVKVKYFFLLGSADSGVKTETGWDVFAANGRLIEASAIIGLIGTPGIDLWLWLESIPEGSVLCTGREFIGALGVKDAKSAKVYTINTVTRTVTEVV